MTRSVVQSLVFLSVLIIPSVLFAQINNNDKNKYINEYKTNLSHFSNISFHGKYEYSYGIFENNITSIEDAKEPPKLTHSSSVKKEYYITPKEIWEFDEYTSHEKYWDRTGERLYKDALLIDASLRNEEVSKMNYAINAEDLVLDGEVISQTTFLDFLKMQARFSILFGYILLMGEKSNIEISYMPDIMQHLDMSVISEQAVKFHGVWNDYNIEIEFDTSISAPRRILLIDLKKVTNSSRYNYTEYVLTYDNKDTLFCPSKIATIEKKGRITVTRHSDDFLSTKEVEIPARYIKTEIVTSDVQSPVQPKSQKIRMNIPNGTDVFYQGNPQTRYIWLNGQIVLKTNENKEQITK